MERYIDAATGEILTKKPEHMTQLWGNRLVEKTHPRIVFRGELDSLIADALAVQLTACERGERAAAADVGQVIDCLWKIMAAEVRETPLAEEPLLGMEPEALHRTSQDVKTAFGMEHPTPDCSMGRLCVELNRLRTRVREAEIAAIRALPERTDILRAMNRLSSAVYVIFCRQLSGWYETMKE